MDYSSTIKVPAGGIRDPGTGNINLPQEVSYVLIPQNIIKKRIEYLCKDIFRKFNQICMLTVLNGALPFSKELTARLKARGLDVEEHHIKLSSYKGAHSTGKVTVEGNLPDVSGKNVLIVEDIVDMGLTLKHLGQMLYKERPAGMSVCTLLHKKSKSPDMKLDFVGFEVPDLFVVGYGLDYNNRFRELPYVGVMDSKYTG